MQSRRVQKVAEAIREVVSMAILAELKDPRVQGVTVTFVEVSGDLRYSKIHVSVMGDDKRQDLTLRGLQSAAGFLQAKVAERLALRYTPRLSFHLDGGVKKSIEIARILREVLPPSGEPDASGAEPAGDGPAGEGPVEDEPGEERTDAPTSAEGSGPA